MTRAAAPGSWKRFLRLTFGWLLLAGGIIGLFLPVLQGIAMIVAGLLLLGKEYPWAGALAARLRRRPVQPGS